MMATGGTEGKGSSGAKFRPPPAAVWNNMIDAGRAWADSQLDSPGGPPTRSRPTDIIKIKNTSGDARRTGEVLKIEGKSLDTITAEHIWLMGVEPTADCYFGILKKPVADDGIEQLQVSGCCMALIDIQDVDHRRADIVAGEYVLQSSNSGPIEILYALESTGEQTCVVRFGGGGGDLQAGIVTAARTCNPGYYTVQLADWSGTYNNETNTAECPTYTVTGSGTTACAIEIIEPPLHVTGRVDDEDNPITVLAYDCQSTVVPLKLNKMVLLRNLGHTVTVGTGEEAVVTPVWQIVRGRQVDDVYYEDEYDCCDGEGETGVETLISRVPSILVGFRLPPITCGTCTPEE